METRDKTATITPTRKSGRKPPQIATENHSTPVTEEALDPDLEYFLVSFVAPTLPSMYPRYAAERRKELDSLSLRE